MAFQLLLVISGVESPTQATEDSIKFGKHVVPVIAVLFWEIVGVDIILGIVMLVKLLKS